ncbi:hypothetical protein M3O59_000670 [Xanthomonas nasturtii]|nr:hypothetical protein M3O59_000670 [Xanthomonas nasturtii]
MRNSATFLTHAVKHPHCEFHVSVELTKIKQARLWTPDTDARESTSLRRNLVPEDK